MLFLLSIETVGITKISCGDAHGVRLLLSLTWMEIVGRLGSLPPIVVDARAVRTYRFQCAPILITDNDDIKNEEDLHF